MEIGVEITFERLLDVVKTLTLGEKLELRKVLDEDISLQNSSTNDFIEFLLNGPVYTENDIAIIENNRKSIGQWRRRK